MRCLSWSRHYVPLATRLHGEPSVSQPVHGGRRAAWPSVPRSPRKGHRDVSGLLLQPARYDACQVISPSVPPSVPPSLSPNTLRTSVGPTSSTPTTSTTPTPSTPSTPSTPHTSVTPNLRHPYSQYPYYLLLLPFVPLSPLLPVPLLAPVPFVPLSPLLPVPLLPPERTGNAVDKKITNQIRAMDKDGDGDISAGELASPLPPLPRYP